MSNADSEEVSVVVERGGITVEKSFEPDDFPVPAIAFVIHSDREEATDVRIVDDVPDDVPAQDIGFHPKYGADFWRVEDEQIVFEREFEAGEEYTTVYGLRAKDTDNIDRFLTEPTIEGVEGEETVSDIIGTEDEEAADDTDEAAEDEEPDTSIDLDDPLDADADAEGEEDEGADTDAPTPAEASADDLESAIANVDEADADAEETDGEDEAAVDESAAAHEAEAEHGNGTTEAVAVDDIAATLAAELRAGEVDEADLETLNEALGPDLEAMSTEAEIPGHVEAKLDKLQSDVDEVVAYTGALEEFLDDAGAAEDLMTLREEFADIEEHVERLDGTVSAVESDVTAVDERVDGLDGRVESMAETTESLDGRIETLEDDLAALRTDLETMEDELGEDLSGRVADVEAELEEMEDDIETLDNLRQALAGN